MIEKKHGKEKAKGMKEKKSIREYEKRIRQRQETIFSPEFERNEIKVADISFAFENHELIKKLKERGTAIKKLDYEKINKLDEEIDKYVREPDNREKLRRPVCAFITFEREIGHEEAIDLTE